MILNAPNPKSWFGRVLLNLFFSNHKNKDEETLPSQSTEDNQDKLSSASSLNELEDTKNKTFPKTVKIPLTYSEEAILTQKNWCNQLANLIGQIDLATYQTHSKRGQYFSLAEGLKTTLTLSNYVYKTLSQLAAQFNDTAHLLNSDNRVRLTITKHVTHDTQNPKKGKSPLVSEFRITSATRSLSIKCETGRLYAYLLPANVNLDLQNNETEDRMKLGIFLDSSHDDWSWTVNGLPVSEDEIIYLLKALLRDLVILSCLDYFAYQSGKKFEHVDNVHRVGIARGYKDSLSLSTELSSDLVQDLVFAQQNTVQKLLKQQEEIQASIARDLHDTVLADIMMLVRRLSSEDTVKKEMLTDTLEEISMTIREICQGLVPRDLKDWGLETVLEDLVDKTAERMEADFSFNVEGRLPDLPSSVQLHIFRIVQEALNNVEKYSEAKNVKVELSTKDELLTVQISDDGKGFDKENGSSAHTTATTGGFGLPSINERIEIIRAYYPARLKFESKKGKGTTIKLEITVEGFK